MEGNDKRPDSRGDVPGVDQKPLHGAQRPGMNGIFDEGMGYGNESESLDKVLLELAQKRAFT